MWYFIFGLLAAFTIIFAVRKFLGFSAQSPDHYADQSLNFDIREHLNGEILCEGMIYGPTGRVTSRFVATMHATWNGNVGHMTEHFKYDSGTVQDREWTLKVNDDGSIKATAPDLKGDGSGKQAGSAVMLNYAIELPPSAGSHVLNVTDWMYLMENGTIMNRSQFRKFGFKVAELVATMRPMDGAQSKTVLQEAA